ncbi:hypothetical protein N7474_008250 [Penicillium riverlandense]|uniref:uncharacterized protein n=1 Tax=Penicillium riverlandense TaxID=1903569 RepID=UPI002547954B|nr:uncharacterized protein N7474_008250 [Penicillium riverlandense]KAJ5811949.1 hypothetical protein N7474_008250 [Penicillium riverlandense]
MQDGVLLLAGARTTQQNVEKCKFCGKKESLDVSLTRCGRCVTQYYCSREHQKADWPNHKHFCREPAAYVYSPQVQAPPRGLSVYIEKPFHRLNEKAWLHNRSEQDVYMLLIDAYRLRMDDNWTRHLQTESDNIYGGAPNSCASFLRFLRLVESRDNLLPAWWSPEKADECMASRNGWNMVLAYVRP